MDLMAQQRLDEPLHLPEKRRVGCGNQGRYCEEAATLGLERSDRSPEP